MDIKTAISQERKNFASRKIANIIENNRSGVRYNIVHQFFEWRNKNTISCKDAAKKLGYDRTYLCRVESGIKPASDRLIVRMIRLMEMKNGKSKKKDKSNNLAN